jgi:hypothetical protein
MAASFRMRWPELSPLAMVIGAFVVFAAVPWIVASANAPMLPPSLAATPTAYALTSHATATAARAAELNKPTRIVLVGLANAEVELYRCPGSQFATGRTLSSGQALRVYGWGLDTSAAEWLLVSDDNSIAPAGWIRSTGISVTPPDFHAYYAEASICE